MSNVKETKELIEFTIRAGEALDASLADKKFSFTDLPRFMPSTMLLSDAINGAGKIIGELSSMGDPERTELRGLIGTLSLKNKKREDIIKSGFEVAISTAIFIGKIQATRKK